MALPEDITSLALAIKKRLFCFVAKVQKTGINLNNYKTSKYCYTKNS